MCLVILKAHVLTGCDVTSKIGTKSAALNAQPELFLPMFGKEDRLTESTAELAEAFLTKVLQPNTSSSTFNDLRIELYHKKSLIDLPPTSHSITAHLQRCHFVCRQCILLLDSSFQEDPCDNGWVDDSGLILPAKHLLSLPEYYLVKCGCKSLAQLCLRNCKCARNDVSCTEYCKCRGLCHK